MIYERRGFFQDIEKIKQIFTDKNSPDYLMGNIDFKENLPIDSLGIYFKQIWDNITSNKKLFLPSEKKIAALHRCTEIKKQKLEEFLTKLDKIQFSKIFTTEISRIHRNIVSIYTNETKHYDAECWESCLNELEKEINNAINIFCEKAINKICMQSQKSLLLEYEELYKMKKFDNVYNDFEIILKNNKNKTEISINQCMYRNIDYKKIEDIFRILDSIFKSQFQKFLNYFLLENENILIRKFMEEFNYQVKNGLNFKFWQNFNLNMQNKIIIHQQNFYNLLTKNFRLEELDAKDIINKLLIKVINEISDQMKTKFNENLDVLLIKQLKNEINIGKDGKIIEWSNEEKFLIVFNDSFKSIDQLISYLQFGNLKLQIFEQNFQKQIIIFDNNENLKNKKDLIQKELISFREATVNQIVGIFPLFCNNVCFFR